MRDSTFQITKNRLSSPSGIASLTVTNRQYRVHFFYEGDYSTDRDRRQVDSHRLLMSCVPLSNDALPLTCEEGTIKIESEVLTTLSPQETDQLIARLTTAKEAALQLQRVYDTYFTYFTDKGKNKL